MKVFRFTLVFFILMLLFCASTNAELNSDAKAVEQATKMQESYIKEDYETFFKFNHPALIKGMGGKDKFTEHLKTGMKQMKEFGVQLLSVSVKSPIDKTQGKDGIYNVLPYTVTSKIFGKTNDKKSYLMGYSTDEGISWVFLDIGDPVILRKKLPSIPKNLVLPKPKKTVMR